MDDILLEDKYNPLSDVKPLNEAGSIDVILLECKYKFWSDVKPVNVAGSIDDIWLASKYNPLSDVKPLNVAGSMDDIWFEDNHNVWSDVKPLNVAVSIVLIFLPLRVMLLDFKGLQRQTSAKFCWFKLIWAFILSNKITKTKLNFINLNIFDFLELKDSFLSSFYTL